MTHEATCTLSWSVTQSTIETLGAEGGSINETRTTVSPLNEIGLFDSAVFRREMGKRKYIISYDYKRIKHIGMKQLRNGKVPAFKADLRHR